VKIDIGQYLSPLKGETATNVVGEQPDLLHRYHVDEFTQALISLVFRKMWDTTEESFGD
jgi:hypothetical protein